MPVCPRASTSTTTIVVESHSSVPSDSGSSVGISIAWTLISAVYEFLELALDRLGDDLAARGIAGQRMRQLLRLLEADVRREWRHLRVGHGLNQHRLVRAERVVPGVGDLLRIVHTDAAEPEQLGVACVREVRQ